jgi:hypothetical protein|tara:strand:- start:12550 stop:13326 length:777 start_codon:yes stop_codon:yes gene_type:complete
MITCDLLGPGNPGGVYNYGLGNQLFQIASLLSLAKDNDDTATFPMLLDPSFGNYYDTILSGVNTYTEGLQLSRQCNEMSFDYQELPYYEDCIYRGYFQSEKYFKHNRDYILDCFDFSTEAEVQYKDVLKTKTVSLHVRRGDYVNLQNHHPLQPQEYYIKSLEEVGGFDSILVFSDDISWCKENLILPNAMYVEKQSDVCDLKLMSLCDNNIIANSSFSWWGAWLNKSKDKKVVAPKNWFGPDKNLNDSDIVPEDWIKI